MHLDSIDICVTHLVQNVPPFVMSPGATDVSARVGGTTVTGSFPLRFLFRSTSGPTKHQFQRKGKTKFFAGGPKQRAKYAVFRSKLEQFGISSF